MTEIYNWVLWSWFTVNAAAVAAAVTVASAAAIDSCDATEILLYLKKICYDAHSVKNNIRSNAIPRKMLAVFAAAAAGATRYATATYKVLQWVN